MLAYCVIRFILRSGYPYCLVRNVFKHYQSSRRNNPTFIFLRVITVKHSNDSQMILYSTKRKFHVYWVEARTQNTTLLGGAYNLMRMYSAICNQKLGNWVSMTNHRKKNHKISDVTFKLISISLEFPSFRCETHRPNLNITFFTPRVFLKSICYSKVRPR